MSELQSLGYLGVQTRRLDDWRQFASRFLGMQVVDSARSSLAFRMDDRSQRVFVEAGDTEGPRVFGWETRDADSLRGLAARLETAGVRVTVEPRALCDQRLVKELISFVDPAGNRLEVFHGPLIAADPFTPGRSIAGFRTGALGLGHVVLTVERVEDMLPFYRDLLGFRLSDYTLSPFAAYFFHLNARHHSFAMVGTGVQGFHHLMIEMMALDDVGQAYDLAQLEEGRVAVTLGRHTNDFITSFYANCPSDFMVECGWGGRSIDPATWEPFECDYGPSLWGHERSWLSPEGRLKARDIRLAAAAAGRRERVQVLPGQYQVMSDD